MQSDFFAKNRQKLLDALPDGAVAVLFAGGYSRKTGDENYPFYAHRSYVYLTGNEQLGGVLLLKKLGGASSETLFLPPKDPMWERWNGERLGADTAAALGDFADVRPLDGFEAALDMAFARQGGASLWLDFDKMSRNEADSPAYRAAREFSSRFPHIPLRDVGVPLKALRAIKAPCEIAAMREAERITGLGIAAMMRVARDGVREYNLKAAFEHALMDAGVLPAFPPIISSGANNFCIHNYGYQGAVKDGDMILNDVGARYDFMGTDVSRGWPVSGRFVGAQKALYACAYATSEHLFSVLKPGLPHSFVDAEVRRFCAERLVEAGFLSRVEDAARLMWHGGAHHVGFDTHDTVDVVEKDRILQPGMVFCVDVGIYDEKSGVGFRLEDNCVITETGCENLSAAIPRSMADIEAAMAR